MISIASTLINPDRVSLASASPLTSLISRVRKTSFCCELGGELFKQEKDDASPAECERETGVFGKCFQKQQGEVVL